MQNKTFRQLLLIINFTFAKIKITKSGFFTYSQNINNANISQYTVHYCPLLLLNVFHYKICAVVGGMSSQKQERLLNLKPQVVIATPGRLWKMIKEVGNFTNCLYDTICTFTFI